MRKHYIDYLRVLAIIAVITIHVSVHYYIKFNEIERIDWWVANILNAASRFAVPLFVMISGAVLIGRNYGVGEFYKKRAIRLLPAIIFWNIFYIGFSLYKGMTLNGLIYMLEIDLFAQGKAAGHLWYLSMFFCLMLFVPYINKLLTGDKPSPEDLKILYYIIFFFFILNGISSILYNMKGISVVWFQNFPWFMAYFVIGYFIDKHGKIFSLSNKKTFMALIVLTLSGAALNYILVNFYGIFKDNTGTTFVFLSTVIIFQLTKVNSHVFKENKTIAKISEASFGMYLIHPIFIYFFVHSLPAYNSHALVYIPVTILSTSLVSFFTITILRKFALIKAIC